MAAKYRKIDPSEIKIDPLILADARFHDLFARRFQKAVSTTFPSWPCNPRFAVEYHVRCLRRSFAKKSRRLFAQIAERSGKRCVHCNRKTRLVVDHVLPLTWGGSNDLFNLQLLCLWCNSAKRNTLPRIVVPEARDA